MKIYWNAFKNGFANGSAVPLAWLLSWWFYWWGHGYSKALLLRDDSERWVAFWYPPYDSCMQTSLQLQEWVGKEGKYWPWGKKGEVA